MLDRLGGYNQTRVDCRRALKILDDLCALLRETVDRRAGFSLRFLVDGGEALVERRDLRFRRGASGTPPSTPGSWPLSLAWEAL